MDKPPPNWTYGGNKIMEKPPLFFFSRGPKRYFVIYQ